MQRVEIIGRREDGTFTVKKSGVITRIAINGMGDIHPAPGTEAFIQQIGGDPDDFILLSINDGKSPKTKEGELFIYSIVGGEVKSSIYFADDGKLILNDGEGNAMEYNAFASSLATMQAAINTELGKIATALTTLGATYAPTPINTSFDSAKVEDIKL